MWPYRVYLDDIGPSNIGLVIYQICMLPLEQRLTGEGLNITQ